MNKKVTKIDIPFVIGEEVLIDPLNSIKGRIKAFWITKHGIEIDVRYVIGEKVDHDYFFEDEIKKVKEEKRTGF